MNKEHGTLQTFKELSKLYLEENKYGIKNMSPKIIIEAQKSVLRILVRVISTKIVSLLSEEYHEGLKPKKILLIESTSSIDGFGIGDGIFKTPAIKALAETFETKIDLVCLENRKEIFESNPNISDIITTKGKSSIAQLTSIIGKILFKKYDLVVNLNYGTKIGLIKLFAGIQTPHINEDIRDLDYNINHTKRNIKVLSKHIPEIEKYENDIPKLYISEKTKEWSKEELKYIKGTKIAVFIGAINGLKDYKKYAEIIQGLNNLDNSLNFILIGAPDDANKGEILENKFENVTNFVGKTNIKEAFGLINEMDLCIGSDGSLTNAAVALGKKVVVLFSIIKPELIIANTVKNVEKIIGECPNGTRCHETSTGKRCSVTGQTNRNFSNTPPCLENLDSEEIIIKTNNLKNN